MNINHCAVCLHGHVNLFSVDFSFQSDDASPIRSYFKFHFFAFRMNYFIFSVEIMI
jgi:hypothetical protein